MFEIAKITIAKNFNVYNIVIIVVMNLRKNFSIAKFFHQGFLAFLQIFFRAKSFQSTVQDLSLQYRSSVYSTALEQQFIGGSLKNISC